MNLSDPMLLIAWPTTPSPWKCTASGFVANSPHVFLRRRTFDGAPETGWSSGDGGYIRRAASDMSFSRL
jgi:hypothetical protein